MRLAIALFRKKPGYVVKDSDLYYCVRRERLSLFLLASADKDALRCLM